MQPIGEIIPLWLENKDFKNNKMKICLYCFKVFNRNPRYSDVQWIKSKFCTLSCNARYRNIGAKKGITGKDHPAWKGNNVTYSAIHKGLVSQYGNPEICIACGKTEKLDWANISGLYKREIEDYIGLCRKCHVIYDDLVNKSWRTRKIKQWEDQEDK